MKQFIASARLIQPLGRVVTAQEGQQLNLLLEDGDTVVIPTRTNVVRVGGEVQMTAALVHRDGLDAGDYIELAGGYSDRADLKRVLILRPDASVKVASASSAVSPGDEVLVPPRIDSKRLQNTMDVVQIIYQIAVAAGVAIAPVLAATN